MDVNMYQPTAMLKKFLPNLLDRTRDKKQSGLIVVSSMTGNSALPAGATYAASKAYVNYLTLGLEQELESQDRARDLDLQVLAPFFVRTQMINNVTIPLQFLTVASTESVVRSSLRQMGHERLPGELPITTGCFKHDIQVKLINFLYHNTPMNVTKAIAYFFYNK